MRNRAALVLAVVMVAVFAPVFAGAQPSAVPVESVESLVLNSSEILVGRVVEFASEDGDKRVSQGLHRCR